MDSKELTIVRKRSGKGFVYRYASGRKITAKRVLQRINKLVIPPKWEQVRIAKDPKQALQVTGYDEKQRKQYIYHPDWHASQQQKKFERLSEFGEVLPDFRQHCWKLVEQPDWPVEKTMALVCLLLDHTGLRVGNRQYTQSNNTFGLTTLRRKHVQHNDDTVQLAFIGKHNKKRRVDIEDPELANLVAQSADERGYALFRYEDDNGWHDVDASDVNRFIHSHLGEAFTCKDFRTWGASRYGLLSLPEVREYIAKNQRRKWAPSLTSHVARMLGNTPTVCRKYYLHPQLISLVDNHEQRQQVIDEVSGYLGAGDITTIVTQSESLLTNIIKP